MEYSSLKTPLKKAKNLGSAKSGSHHWLMQRMTAVILLVLTIWFMSLILIIYTQSLEASAIILHPLNILALGIYINTALYHGMLGMQVIIEDYIHCKKANLISLILLKLVTILTIMFFSGAIISCYSKF